MTEGAHFQALGAFSVLLTNVFRAKRLPWGWSRHLQLAALAVALLLSSPATGSERDLLMFGITQFPSTRDAVERITL